MGTVLRFGVNLLIKSGLFWIFNYIGWIALNPGRNDQTSRQVLVNALVMGVVFVLVSMAIYWLYAIVSVATCGVTVLLLPVMFLLSGYLVLWLVAHNAPAFLALTHGFWITALVGLIVSLAGLPNGKSSEADED